MSQTGEFLGRPIKKLTISDVLSENARLRGSKVYLHALVNDRKYTYGEVDRISNAWARSLDQAGIKKGVHVAVVMDNSDALLLLYFALGKIGAVAVPINVTAKGKSLHYYLELADVDAVICDGRYLDQIVAVAERLPRIGPIIARELLPPQRHERSIVEFESLLGASDEPFDNAVKFSDVAFLAFTSGTTGPSKAVIFTQATMLMVALSYAVSFGYSEDDTYYICLPLFHTSSLRGAAYLSLLTGGSIALAPRFSVSNFWKDIKRSGATTFDLLGAMVNLLWSAPASALDHDHRVRFCRMAPVPPFAREFERRFATRIVSTYGLTDGGAPAAFTLQHPPSKLGACGKLRAGWQVRILDEDDLEVPTGTIGEIGIRCDVPWHMPSGYYKMPDATVKANRNGWFHTGDRGYFDHDGFLYFKDRIKDVIRRRGENISAWEVEQIIQAHPAVDHVAAYPVTSTLGEDEVAVSVVLKADVTLSREALLTFCRGEMLPHMVPSLVEFVDNLPLNESQKVDKRALRARSEAALKSDQRA